MPLRVLSIRDLFKQGVKKLSHIQDSELDVRICLEAATGLSRSQVLIGLDQPVSADVQDRFWGYVNKRMKDMPLAYVLGTAWFMGREFWIQEGVLIPRPETELLVQSAIQAIRAQMKDSSECLIFECGFGSGVISIELGLAFPEATIHAWDISKWAVQTAIVNAERHAVSNVQWHHGDFFDSTALWRELVVTDKPSILISNPPYIPAKDIPTLDVNVKDFEPLEALSGGEDGLDFYRKLLQIKEEHALSLYLESGISQAKVIQSLTKSPGQIIKDYQGIDRVIVFPGV